MDTIDSGTVSKNITPPKAAANTFSSKVAGNEVVVNKIAEASAEVAAEIRDQKIHSAEEMQELRSDLEQTIRALNIKMEVKSSRLNFSVDEVSDRVMVTVTNKNTGEIVRQVPADAILKVAHNMEALKGVIFDEMF